MTDWVAWHGDYDDPASPLSRRRATVQRHVREFLDSRPDGARVVSACAGDGRDILDVLEGRRDRDRFQVTLIELDPDLAAQASRPGVDVRQVDAGQLGAYAGAVPADLVMLCGVFGNISDADVHRTVSAVPMLCAGGATVVWTRHRRDPDLTPRIRHWFAETGFAEMAFDAPRDTPTGVGVHRFERTPQALGSGELFRFLR